MNNQNKRKPITLFLENVDKKLSNEIIKLFIKKVEISKTVFDLEPNQFLISLREFKKIKKIALKSLEGKDITFDVKYRWFYNVRLSIRKGVFVPQPDTEGIISLILNDYSECNKKIISGYEVGTGTGAIAIALTKNNEKINISTIEKSKKAFKLAQMNAIENGTYGKIKFENANFLTKKDFDEKYDFIVSNPPYIEKKDKTIEKGAKNIQPNSALYAKHSGIDFYNKIFSVSEKILKPGGRIYFEIGHNQKESLKPVIPKEFKCHKFHKDLNGKYRFLVLEK